MSTRTRTQRKREDILQAALFEFDARGFRDAVMRQKELLAEGTPSSAGSSAAPGDGSGDSAVSSAESIELLREIRDSLRRIEGRSGT